MATETHVLDVGGRRLVARVTRVDRRTAVALEVDGVEVAERQGWPVVRVPVEDLEAGLEKATVVVVAPRPGRATVRLVVPAASGAPTSRPERIEFEPPAGTRAHRRYLWAQRHPQVYAARHVVVASAQVVGGLLLARIALGFVLDLDWAWLPDWHLPRIPRPNLPDLPNIPWPDLDLPDWSLPGLAGRGAGQQEVLVPDPRRDRRRRRRSETTPPSRGGRRGGEGDCSAARTVDPAKHAARRLQIIDAGLTCFAAHGYDRATTALICREAGIGSGTFFHYFPTKADLLVATLVVGTGEPQEWFAARRGRPDAVAGAARVRRPWAAAEFADPRVPGFVRAVGAVMTEPRIASALAADERTLRGGLLPWVRKAQAAGQVRKDLSAPRLTEWLMLLLDGFLGRLAGDDAFTAKRETRTLLDAVERLLAP